MHTPDVKKLPGDGHNTVLVTEEVFGANWRVAAELQLVKCSFVALMVEVRKRKLYDHADRKNRTLLERKFSVRSILFPSHYVFISTM